MKKNTLALFGGPQTRKKPFPQKPIMGAEERRHVAEVLKSGRLSGFIANAGEPFLGGPKVRHLEKLFCDYFSVPYAVAVNSATAGLHAALAACNIGPGDEVIVPPYTMCASASAVLMNCAVPRFVDIRDDVFSLDPVEIEKNINSRTKGIVVVHLFGHPAPMDEIVKIARKHKLFVIEDCAQAPGAIYKGKYVGTIGDAGIFSFNQHKTITTGEGGVVVTNSEAIAVKTRLVRNHGEAVVEDMGFEDIQNTLGWNYRMTELEAGVGIGQFNQIDPLTKHRQGLAQYLSKELKKFPAFELPVTWDKCSHVYFLYPIKYDEKKAGISRANFIKAMNAEGIPFGAGYVKPLYMAPLYQRQLCYGKDGWPFTSIPESERPSYKKGLCPVTERLHEKQLIHTNLCYYPATKKDMRDIVDAAEKIFSQPEAFKNVPAAQPEKRKKALVR